MKLEASTVVPRPLSTVWDFYAVHHVENHPRWDPTVQLEYTGPSPLGVGSVIDRRTTRGEHPTEGTMRITAFEPERLMEVETRDGSMTFHGRARFERVDDHHTRLTIGADFPGMDQSTGDRIRSMMEGSLEKIRSLIEAES